MGQVINFKEQAGIQCIQRFEPFQDCFLQIAALPLFDNCRSSALLLRVEDLLCRLRHDLVKRVLWPARDLLDSGAAPTAADAAALRAGLHDLVAPDGAPATARELWRRFRAEAPTAVPAAALDAFERALEAAATAVDTRPPAEAAKAVLEVEPAFQELARHVDAA